MDTQSQLQEWKIYTIIPCSGKKIRVGIETENIICPFVVIWKRKTNQFVMSVWLLIHMDFFVISHCYRVNRILNRLNRLNNLPVRTNSLPPIISVDPFRYDESGRVFKSYSGHFAIERPGKKWHYIANNFTIKFVIQFLM